MEMSMAQESTGAWTGRQTVWGRDGATAPSHGGSQRGVTAWDHCTASPAAVLPFGGSISSRACRHRSHRCQWPGTWCTGLGTLCRSRTLPSADSSRPRGGGRRREQTHWQHLCPECCWPAPAPARHSARSQTRSRHPDAGVCEVRGALHQRALCACGQACAAACTAHSSGVSPAPAIPSPPGSASQAPRAAGWAGPAP